MSQGLKDGKKPLSAKRSADNFIREDELFGNPLKIPPGLAKEIEDAGLEARFIDAKKLYDNHGYHDKGWTPYKVKTSGIIKEKSEFTSGSDPDGTFRRGSLILAVKPKEACEKHRTLLKQKADRQKGYNKQKAAELRQLAAESFSDAKKVIYEGYDDNDDNGSDD